MSDYDNGVIAYRLGLDRDATQSIDWLFGYDAHIGSLRDSDPALI